MILDSKENNDTAEGNTCVHGSRQDEVVLLPPGLVMLSDIVHEDEGEVHTCGEITQVVRGIDQETSDDQRWLEVFGDLLWSVFFEKDARNWSKGTDQEAPL